MLPEILTLKGFLSYREKQVLDFRKFHIALITGENGQGKSSLLDALIFSLFSKARGVEGNRSGIEDLVTNGENYMEVTFQFVQNETRYRIIRSYNKLKRHSDVRLEREKENGFISLSEGAIRETDAKISEILGMDYDAFVTSSFIMQDKADFFTIKKKDEKIEILRQILGLELYEKARQKTLEKINAISGETVGLQNEIAHLEEELKEIKSIEEAVDQSSEELKNLEEEKISIEEKLNETRKRYSKAQLLKEKIQNNKQKIADLQNRFTSLEELISRSKREKQSLSNIIDREEEIRKKYTEFLENQRTLNELLEKQSAVEKLQREKEKILSEIKIEQEGLKSKAENLEIRINNNEKTISENKKEINKIDETLKNLSEQKTEKEKEESRTLEKVDKLKKNVSTLRKKFAEKITLVSEKEKILSGANGRKESTLKQLKILKAKLEKLLDKKLKYGRYPSVKSLKTETENLKNKEDVLREDLEAAKEEKNKTEKDLQYFKEDIKEIAEKDALIKEGTAVCPLCGSPLTKKHRDKIKQGYREKKEELEKKITVASENLNRLKDKIREIVKLLKKNEDEIQEKEKLLSESISRKSTLQELNNQIKETETEVQLIENLLKKEFITKDEEKVLSDIERNLLPLRDINEETLKTEGEKYETEESVLRKITKELQLTENKIIKSREEMSALNIQNEKLEREISTLKNELSTIEKKVNNADFQKEKREKIKQLEGEIKKTGFEETLLKRCKEKNKKLSQFDELYRTLNEAKVKLKSIKKSLEQRLKEEKEIEEMLEEEKKNRGTLIKELTAFSGIEDELVQINGKFTNISEAFGKAIRKKAIFEEKLRSLNEKKEKLKTLSAQIVEKDYKKKILIICRDMFGRDGIQISIIRDALPAIENIANEMLGRMTNNRMNLKFDTVKQLKSKDKTVNTLDISVFDNGQKRRYELFSGGERFRINLAIRIAISMYLSELNGKPLEMLVMDEGFGSQDENGKMRILEEINSFKDKFRKIIVITHIPEIKENFPYEIRVTKTVRGSLISII